MLVEWKSGLRGTENLTICLQMPAEALWIRDLASQSLGEGAKPETADVLEVMVRMK